MDPAARDARIDEIFDQLLDLPKSERAAALDEACPDEPEIRAAVERLLAWSDEPPSALASSALFSAGGARGAGGASGVGGSPGADGTAGLGAELWPDSGDETLTSTAGTPVIDLTNQRIGPYRLLDELGRGGMGVVFLAERDDGHFSQRVALKVMRPGTESPDLRRRFEQERQIIASLDHPHIARLFDGGVTEDGRPFSAMELVEGLPITDYCDQHRLSIEQRLELFETVAQAVHYAHRNLVVHRDLKPSNILVSERGEIKLLDFGIAKLLDYSALDGHVCSDVALTETGRMPMTPLYASPEQLRGEPVTTASDIYQLGLLLFELVTGERARQDSRSGPPSNAHLLTTADSPLPAPSTAIRKLSDERRQEIALSRDTTPRSLVKALDGDLDTVTLAALHPEIDRRYPSAAELALDLERTRLGFPLSARRDSWGYRARRFLRRHRVAVGIAATFLLVLIGYAVTVTLQAERIAAERDRAEKVLAFALGLYSAGDPNEAMGPEIAAIELVNRGVERMETELSDEPEVQSDLLHHFSRFYSRLGEIDEAERLARRSVALRSELFGEQHVKTLDSMNDLGRLLVLRDDPEALEVLERVLELRRELLGPRHEDTATALAGLGVYLRSVGRHAESAQHLRDALEIHRELDPRSQAVSDDLSELSWTLKLLRRPEEAEPLMREALEINLELFGEKHPLVATTWNNLATTLWQLERWSEGDEAMGKSLEAQRALYGEKHPNIAASLGNAAGSWVDRGELDRAAELYRQALEMRRDLVGPRHPWVARSAAQLGEVLHQLDDLQEAEELLVLALEIFQEQTPDAPFNFARVWQRLGPVWIDLGRYSEAEEILLEAREVFAQETASRWPPRLDVLIAKAQRLQGRFNEALKRLEGSEDALLDDAPWLERWREEQAQLDKARDAT